MLMGPIGYSLVVGFKTPPIPRGPGLVQRPTVQSDDYLLGNPVI